MEPHLTTQQVADLLLITRPTVARYVREGWLRGARIGRTWRIEPESVRRLLAIGMGGPQGSATPARAPATG